MTSFLKKMMLTIFHPKVAMNLTWAVLGFLTCTATPREKELGSATLLMTSFSHAAFSAALYLAAKPKAS